MKDYTAGICELFLEKFPRSAAFRGGRRLRIGRWERIFPEIERDYLCKNAFLDAVEELCDRGICEAGWKRYREGEMLEALYLTDPDRLYAETGRIHPREARRQLQEKATGLSDTTFASALRQLLDDDQGTLPDLLQVDMQREIEALKSLLQDIDTLIGCPAGQREHYTLRQLSISLFHDSKRIEQILFSADSLAARLTGASLTESLGLTRSYPETTCALPGTFIFKDSRRWDLGRQSITLPRVTLEDTAAYESSSPEERILMLENKESYYTLLTRMDELPFDGYLYLGGFPNSADAALLELLSQSGAGLYCFCDLDPAGLLIAQQVIRLCSRRIELFSMDSETYTRYLPYGYSLLDSEVKKLSLIEDPRLLPVAELIAHHRKGIEQEIIPV